MKTGDIIEVNNKLARVAVYKKDSEGYSRRWKIWEKRKRISQSKSMFLRWRALSNGESWYESECGYTYSIKESFRAALVIDMEGNTNPYYTLQETEK